MNLRAFLGLQSVALPLGYNVLDVWRLTLLAVLVGLTFYLLVWTHRIGKDYSKRQAQLRMERMSLYRAQQEKLAAQTDPLADT